MPVLGSSEEHAQNGHAEAGFRDGFFIGLAARLYAPCAFRSALCFLTSILPIYCSVPSLCTQNARNFLPCELAFALRAGDLTASTSTYKDDLLTVEFRSPRATTYLIHEFADNRESLRIRFTPTEPGPWTYKISSSIARLDNQEGSFNVSDAGGTGVVGVANLRHFWTTGKRPHLWFAAEAPFLSIEQNAFETWLDARKHDGFTHIRGIVLNNSGAVKPFSAALEPNPAYFSALDDRLMAAANRGFTLDLILADTPITESVFLNQRDRMEPIIRYIAARYAGLNVTWQGIQQFETLPGTRSLLRDLNLLLKKYDTFQHPRSTDARDSSSPLTPDGWMNYLIEAAPDPQLGAVEHQFTEQPEIHIVQAAEPEAFRHELWNATTNGEYPSVSYKALQNPENVKASQTWFQVVSQTRHWELEPYFDVNGARATGLDEVEYLAYAQKPGIIEITLPRHKYNPVWVNPATGEEIPLKDYRGEVFSRQTPDNSHDWVLTVPRDGQKENMAKYYYFESQEPPVQEVETDPTKAPFDIAQPAGESISLSDPIAYSIKLTRANRASRLMQYVWWGETVQGGEGPRLLGVGASGNSNALNKTAADAPNLNIRVEAINANGKAYELDRVYELKP
jgi:hypothetical protein